MTAPYGSGVTGICTVTVLNYVYTAASADELECSHPYDNNCSDIWIYALSGATTIKVTFDSQTNIEEDFDYLYIYDADGNEVGCYTGTELAGQSIEIAGDTVKLQLVSDESGKKYGFKVTSVEAVGEPSQGTADVPVTMDEPVTTDIPDITDEPGSTDEPGATDEPGSTDGSGTMDEPGSTDEPGSSEIPDTDILYGDVDDDGEVTVSNALMILKAYVKHITLDDAQTERTDVDGSESIDVSEALYVLKYYVKLITEFPVETASLN